MKNIILIHGALGHSSDFDALANLLSVDFKVYSLLFQDHGINNNSNSDLTIPRLVEELDEFINTNAIENPNVFGYSMGGYVALCHSIKFKNKIEKIAVLATKFKWSPEIASAEISFLNWTVIEEKVPKYANQLKNIHGEDNWKILMSKTTDLMLDIGSQNYLTNTNLSLIEIPVQFMLGDSDKMVSLDETLAARSSIKSSSLAVLPNTKHGFETCNTTTLALMLKHFFK